MNIWQIMLQNLIQILPLFHLLLIQSSISPLKNSTKNGQVKIGWVGSHTTVKHFEMITDVYLKLKLKYKDKN